MCFFLLGGLKLNYKALLAPKYKWHYCIIGSTACLVIVKFCRFYSMVELPMAALPCVGNLKVLWVSVRNEVSRSVPALFLQVLFQNCGESLAIGSFIQVLGRNQGEQQWPVSLRGVFFYSIVQKEGFPILAFGFLLVLGILEEAISPKLHDSI